MRNRPLKLFPGSRRRGTTSVGRYQGPGRSRTSGRWSSRFVWSRKLWRNFRRKK